jgi:hypothetical protein
VVWPILTNCCRLLAAPPVRRRQYELPHGHVAAVWAQAKALGLPALLGSAGRDRDLANARPHRVEMRLNPGDHGWSRCAAIAAIPGGIPVGAENLIRAHGAGFGPSSRVLG